MIPKELQADKEGMLNVLNRDGVVLRIIGLS